MLLFSESTVQEKEIHESQEQPRSIIQGELLKNILLKINNLWDSYVAKDPVWLSFPAEMRNYIEEKIAIRNENAHANVENIADYRHIQEKL